jgi:hypothetical protein
MKPSFFGGRINLICQFPQYSQWFYISYQGCFATTLERMVKQFGLAFIKLDRSLQKKQWGVAAAVAKKDLVVAWGVEGPIHSQRVTPKPLFWHRLGRVRGQTPEF